MEQNPGRALLERIPRWRRMQTRAVVTVLVVVVIVASVTSLALVRVTSDHLSREFSHTVVSTAGFFTEQLRDPLLDGNDAAVLKALELSTADPRIAFVAIQEPDGRTDTARIAQSLVWEAYQNLIEGGSASEASSAREAAERNFRLNRPVNVETATRHPARVLRSPILAMVEHGNHRESRLLGYVVVGMIDPTLTLTMARMQLHAAIVAAAACLASIPLTVFLMHRLVRPILRIARATTDLASGREYRRLAIHRNDEIGVLARAFDKMAERLGRARRDLLEANRVLESQVQARTHELEDLNRLLQREIETKNDFLRTVSHDLNAPLRNIAGMVTSVKTRFGESLPEEAVERLDRVLANASIEMEMLNDLLELSRLRTAPGKPEDVDLDEMVRSIVSALDHEISQRGISIEVLSDLPTVHVELRLARQVFLNLIDNAVKYMGDGAEKVIRIDHALQERVLEISVTDTGPGIPEDERERVFQVFRRGTSALSSGKEGRGVGLPAVRMTLERWGGGIRVETPENGRGSRFVIFMPRKRVVCTDCAGRDGPAGTTAVGSTETGGR